MMKQGDRQVHRQVHLRGESSDFKSVGRRHPWFFSGAFYPSDLKSLGDGEAVSVVTKSGIHIGTGYYERGGSIAIRMLDYGENPKEIDEAFFEEKIRGAHMVREALGLTGTEKGYRLIYGEGDGLPGLVADVYSGTVVLQAHTTGMAFRRMLIASAIQKALGEEVKGIYYKSEGTLHFSGSEDEKLYSRDTVLAGKVEEKPFEEDGVWFKPDIIKGQKTGFFLDQRDNRLLLKSYAKGKRVLNMFCYTGGFSLQALAGGADSVVSVDSSEQALSLLGQNLALNPGLSASHTPVAQDAFKYLEQMPGEAFDIVILDPPAFAKSRSALTHALQGYRRLNALALEKMPKGSLLFTFSCSQVVTKELFRQTLFTAALQAGREVRILYQLSQSADHPVSIYHPEGEYLKGLVLYVE